MFYRFRVGQSEKFFEQIVNQKHKRVKQKNPGKLLKKNETYWAPGK